MFERLAGVLEYADEPRDAARAVLEAFLEPPPEALLVGISPNAWRSAFEAMLASADEFESRRVAQKTPEHWAAIWPEVYRELYDLGCELIQSHKHPECWTVTAPGVDVKLDLAEVQIDCVEFGRRHDGLASLPAFVREMTEIHSHNSVNTRNPKLISRQQEWENLLKRRAQELSVDL